MLTIAQFADRTGISPSALRFYERKELLLPARRLENGYRVYAPEQVAEAQLLNSLRQAEVSLADIREFLGRDSAGREAMLAQWRKEATARLLTIQMAGQYLDRLQPDQPQIHLLHWEEPSTLLWFPAQAPPGPLPFAAAAEDAAKRVERLGFESLSGGYVRTLDLANGILIGEVGVRVQLRRNQRPPAEARVQEVPPTRFATLECTTADEKAAHRVFRFMHEFGFNPTGFHLERYIASESDRYQLLIAVMHT